MNDLWFYVDYTREFFCWEEELPFHLWGIESDTCQKEKTLIYKK